MQVGRERALERNVDVDIDPSSGPVVVGTGLQDQHQDGRRTAAPVRVRCSGEVPDERFSDMDVVHEAAFADALRGPIDYRKLDWQALH